MKNLLMATLLGLFGIPTTNAVEVIKPAEAARLVHAGKAILIDVREMSEVKKTGLAKPAAWLAKSEIDGESDLFKAFLKNGNKQTPLIFYCGSGKRAGIVATQIEKLGFKTSNMGGLEDWKAANLPVVPFEERR